MEDDLLEDSSITDKEDKDLSYEPLFDFDRMYSGLLEED